MPKLTLTPISIDRVRNRLLDAVKRGPTKTLRELHSGVLKDIEKLQRELGILDAAMVEHEEEQAKHDAMHGRVRARRVKDHGKDSMVVWTMDVSYEQYLKRRLTARDVATAIAGRMDQAFRSFLDPRATLAELKKAVELGIGVLAGAEPLTITFQVLKGLDEAIDRLDDQRIEAERYALQIETFSLVVRGFTGLFLALRQRVDNELDTISF
jgi:hypothetical protein